MILTVDELREHVTSELGDDALQRLLDAAEEAIVARAGGPGARTEIVGGGHRFISTARPIGSVSSITELLSGATSAETLATNDYRIRTGDMVVERISTGDNASSSWRGLVTIAYTPVDDDATRIGVQIDLVKLALNYAPGMTEETIGEWTQRFGFNSAWTPDEERESILERLDVGLGMVVV